MSTPLSPKQKLAVLERAERRVRMAIADLTRVGVDWSELREKAHTLHEAILDECAYTEMGIEQDSQEQTTR